MPEDIELTLRITVDTPEEADKIYAAAFSGLASELVKLGVLYGRIPFGGAAFGSAAPSLNPTEERERKEERERVASMDLKRVDDEVPVHKPVQRAEKGTAKKPTGLAGRKRFGRS